MRESSLVFQEMEAHVRETMVAGGYLIFWLLMSARELVEGEEDQQTQGLSANCFEIRKFVQLVIREVIPILFCLSDL